MRLIVMVLYAVAVIVSGTIVSASEIIGEETGANALFQKKCIQCHPLSWAKERNKTEAEWAATVMRMKNVNGAPISDEEARIIIDHRTANYGSHGMHHHGMKEMEHK